MITVCGREIPILENEVAGIYPSIRPAAVAFRLTITLLAILFFFQGTILAGDRPTAKWKRESMDGNWANNANWTRAPSNGDNFNAEFRTSTITNISPVYPLGAMTLDPGASAYTFTGDGTFYHVGIINNSGVIQTFIGYYHFYGASTAGNLTDFRGGALFDDGSWAGTASFTADAGTAPGEAGDRVFLFGSRASAYNATFTANGASVVGAGGGEIRLRAASAGTATFIANGARPSVQTAGTSCSSKCMTTLAPLSSTAAPCLAGAGPTWSSTGVSPRTQR